MKSSLKSEPKIYFVVVSLSIPRLASLHTAVDLRRRFPSSTTNLYCFLFLLWLKNVFCHKIIISKVIILKISLFRVLIVSEIFKSHSNCDNCLIDYAIGTISNRLCCEIIVSVFDMFKICDILKKLEFLWLLFLLFFKIEVEFYDFWNHCYSFMNLLVLSFIIGEIIVIGVVVFVFVGS
jgi:hypothetical protein